MADVFISYSRRDKDFVRRLAQALTKRERETWVDLENIAPTAEWLAEIYSGIEGADAFIFVISPDSVTSEDCLRELAHAVEHNKMLIPIVRREVDDEAVPEPLGSYNWVFFCQGDDFDESLQQLVDALDTDLDWVQAHTRLLTRAIEWDANARDNSYVLRGNDLRTAEEWQVRAADKEPKLTALQTDYILASREATRRRQRMTLGAVLVGLVVAVVLMVVAVLARNEAEEQRKVAIEQRNQAIRQSNFLLTRQLTNQNVAISGASALLAIETWQQFPSADSTAIEPQQDIASFADTIAFSPGGREVVGLEQADTPTAPAFSQNGKYLAIASLPLSVDERTLVRVYELPSGREVMHLEHNDLVPSVAFSADGGYLATASLDKTVRVWDLTTSREVARIPHEDRVAAVVFNPEGDYLATATLDGTIRVWRWELFAPGTKRSDL